MHLSKAFASIEPPRVFVLERSAGLKAALQKTFTCPGKAPLTILYCTEHYRRSIRHFFDQAQGKYYAGPAALLDSLCDIKNQSEFDTKLKQLQQDSEELSNQNEKLL